MTSKLIDIRCASCAEPVSCPRGHADGLVDVGEPSGEVCGEKESCTRCRRCYCECVCSAPPPDPAVDVGTHCGSCGPHDCNCELVADPAPVDVGAMRAEIAHARDVLAAGALSWDDAEKLCDALDASRKRVEDAKRFEHGIRDTAWVAVAAAGHGLRGALAMPSQHGTEAQELDRAVKRTIDTIADLRGEVAARTRSSNAHLARAEKAEAELADAGNLLARVHRDGGHHTAKVGWQRACLDAEQVYLDLNAEVERLKYRESVKCAAMMEQTILDLTSRLAEAEDLLSMAADHLSRRFLNAQKAAALLEMTSLQIDAFLTPNQTDKKASTDEPSDRCTCGNCGGTDCPDCGCYCGHHDESSAVVNVGAPHGTCLDCDSANLRIVFRSYWDEFAAANATIAELRGEVERLTGQIDVAHEALWGDGRRGDIVKLANDAATEITDLKARVVELEKQAERRIARRAVGRAELSDASATIADLKARLGEAEKKPTDIRCASCAEPVSCPNGHTDGLMDVGHRPVDRPLPDEMHPTGWCSCAGEGTCEWCIARGP